MKEAERIRLTELYAIEAEAYGQGIAVVAGIDEVGRGALAGPVSAGACVLPRGPFIEYLNDSKKLSPKRREQVSASIKAVATAWSVAHVQAARVDEVGIVGALKDAMRQAVAGLGVAPGLVLLDGNPIGLGMSERSIVKGDALVACIAAASVLAKVERDALMVDLDERYPGYGFATNKGYGALAHTQAIERLGLTAVHRRSFCTRWESSGQDGV